MGPRPARGSNLDFGINLAHLIACSEVARAGNDHQRTQRGLGAQGHGPPIQAGEVAREAQGLASQERAITARQTQSLPVQAVQLRRVGTNRQTQAQRQILSLSNRHGLIEEAARGWVGEELPGKGESIGCRIVDLLVQRTVVKAYRRQARVALVRFAGGATQA